MGGVSLHLMQDLCKDNVAFPHHWDSDKTFTLHVPTTTILALVNGNGLRLLNTGPVMYSWLNRGARHHVIVEADVKVVVSVQAAAAGDVPPAGVDINERPAKIGRLFALRETQLCGSCLWKAEATTRQTCIRRTEVVRDRLRYCGTAAPWVA